MKRVLLSLVVVLTTTVHCQDSTTDVSSTTILDCGYLANSYKDDYYGQCCNPKAVAYMDEVYGNDWRENLADAVSRTTNLFKQKLCDVSSTSSTTAATSTTTELNCDYLKDSASFTNIPDYNGECCNAQSVDFLNKKYPGWRSYSAWKHVYVTDLRKADLCGGSTTSTVISTSSTTITTTSEFESTGLKSTTEAETSSESGECIFSVLSNTLSYVFQFVKSSLV
ncbi:hypothetical protein B9Z55_004043 [Caenorhabditis nigoni]|uniref:DUF19 domain-containing protein n=1 Tax=Caenorhabditis nigoni TaxID=1611254 RepID=A0A2G5UUQ0_9PELO|nr:hypothetical protein B9Z55_004043 [Caenorhabditis nigoni]